MNLSKDILGKLFLMYRMYFRAGEKKLGALAGFADVLSSNPSNQKVDHYHLSWDTMPSSFVSEDRDIMLAYKKLISKSLKIRNALSIFFGGKQ